jgi:hypothetical protein
LVIIALNILALLVVAVAVQVMNLVVVVQEDF